MQDSWLRKKAEEIQSSADRKDMKMPPHYLAQILTDKDAILERWAEHFNSVLNRPSSVNKKAINRLPRIESNVPLDEFPTITETRKAIQHLFSGKAPGTDAIRAEVYKAGSPNGRKTDRVVSMHVEEGCYPHETSRMLPLSTYTNGKEILKSVTTTEVSLS